METVWQIHILRPVQDFHIVTVENLPYKEEKTSTQQKKEIYYKHWHGDWNREPKYIGQNTNNEQTFHKSGKSKSQQDKIFTHFAENDIRMFSKRRWDAFVGNITVCRHAKTLLYRIEA